MSENGNKLVLAGAGQLNRRVANRWQTLGDVAAMRLSSSDPSLGFAQVQVDLAQSAWPDLEADYLVVALASRGERTLENYRRAYLEPLKRLGESLGDWQTLPKRILVVSSSRVYGVDDGQLVDDDWIAAASDERAAILLDMESMAMGLPTTTIVARLSGLYGPGRDWLKRKALAAETGAFEDKWTNRIHVDDAAGAIIHLLQLASPKLHYIVSDREPQTLATMFNFFRSGDGLPLFEDTENPLRGKRLMPSRLIQSGFEWRYPTAFSGGYEAD